ncbi:hypothetical protein Pelo_12241 [Pelomyxa schiedti]|nr:hypothetical protein Pelo_12241 [Pelomyxa schiedti]
MAGVGTPPAAASVFEYVVEQVYKESAAASRQVAMRNYEQGREAARMVRGALCAAWLGSYLRLHGVVGAPPCDVPAIEAELSRREATHVHRATMEEADCTTASFPATEAQKRDLMGQVCFVCTLISTLCV